MNGTDRELTALQVFAAGHSFEIGDLAPHEKRKFKLRRYSDSDWKVLGTWRSKDPLSLSFGYITGGAYFDDKLVLHGDGSIHFGSVMWYFIPPLKTEANQRVQTTAMTQTPSATSTAPLSHL